MNTYLNGWPEFRPYRYRGTGRDTLTAWMDDGPKKRNYPKNRRPASRILQPCGTTAAYRHHRRRGEPVCLDCRQAVARDTADRVNGNEAYLANRRDSYRRAREAGLPSRQANNSKRRRAA